MFNNRVKPFDEEGLNSYIYRLAKANYFNGIKFFCEKHGVEIRYINNNEFPLTVVKLLATLTEVPEPDLAKQTTEHLTKSWGDHLKRQALLKTNIKYCPCCIKKEIYHKSIWNISAVSICLKHRAILIDKCQKCAKRIRISNFMKGTCGNCGCQFRKAPYQVVKRDTFEYLVQQSIQNKIADLPDNYSNPFLAKLSFKEIMFLSKQTFHLLRGLSSFVFDKTYPLEIFSNAKKGKHDNLNSLISYTNVYWVYDNPENLSILFEKLKAQRRKKMIQIIKSNDYHEQQVLMFFKQMLEETTRRMKKNTPKEDIPLPKLISTIKDETNKRKKRVNCAAVYDSSVAIKMEPNDWLRREEAANILGIGKREQINTLINEGFLKLTKFPGNQFYVHRMELDNLFKSLHIRTIKKDVNLLPFYDAIKMYSKFGLSLVKLLGFLKKKRIKAYQKNKSFRLGEFLFRKADLEQLKVMLIGERQQNKGYTMDQVSKVFQLDRRTIHLLVDKGDLAPTEVFVYQDGRKNYFFEKSCVDEFREKYIFMKEAVEQYNISYQKIRAWVIEGKLKDHFNGVRNKYLIEKKQIEQLIGIENRL